MASLAQILAHHGCILVLDAASTRIQVGLLCTDQAARWRTSAEDAGQAVFAETSALLSAAGLGLAEVNAFVYCEGPGSMLGVRTVAMALRTWATLRTRPCYTYQSLAAVARREWVVRPRGFTVIADARRDSWHSQTVSADGTLAPLQRLPASALSAGELLTPESFRVWAALPPQTQRCAYDLPAIIVTTVDDDLLRETASPDAFQHEAPEYRKWLSQVHSAATANRS